MDSEFQANVNNYWQKIFGSDELMAIFATRFETALKANDGNEERCSEKAGSSLEKNFGGKHTDRIFAVRFKRSKSSSQKGVAQPGKTERKGRKKNLVEFAKTSTFATHFKKNERLKAARSSGVKNGLVLRNISDTDRGKNLRKIPEKIWKETIKALTFASPIETKPSGSGR